MIYVIYYKGKEKFTTRKIKIAFNKLNEYTEQKITNETRKKLYSGHTNNIKGYTIKKYFDDEIPEKTINYKGYNRQYKGKYKSEYYDKIFALDIETSTYNIEDGRKCSIMYLCGIKGILCNPKEINVNNFNDFTTPYYSFRNWNEVDNFLEYLNNIGKQNKKNVILFIHNLSYEFSFFQNSNFVKKHFKNDNLCSVKSRQPFKLLLDRLDIRCSYKLINQSLGTIGNNLGFKKLTDIKGGYYQKYTPISKLPKSELIYNERDVDVTLLGVINTLKNSNAFNSINDIDKLLTSTGLTRAENKINNNNEILKNYSLFVKGESKKYNLFVDNNLRFYKFLENSFVGGYVRGNRFFMFKPFRNVGSIDITSSYPAQMLNRYFPFDWKIIDNKKNNLLELLNSYIENNNAFIKNNMCVESEKCLNNIFKNNTIENAFFKLHHKIAKDYFICEVELENVYAKKYLNDNEMPLLSLSKIININNSKIEVDNGRIIFAEKIKTTLTNIDILNLQFTYNFTITNCNVLIHTQKAQKLNQYVINSVMNFAVQKTILKALLKRNIETITENDFFSKTLNKYIFNETILKSFFNFNNKEKTEFLQEQLKLAKNRLNGQYGINVQKVAPNEILYNIISNEWEDNETNSVNTKNLLRNYSDGVFITAYSRLQLVMMSYLLFRYTKTTVLYWDTDSIKFVNDIDNVLKCVKKFNKCLQMGWNTEQRFKMGEYDFEGVYSNFIQGGAKCYMYEENSKIHISISGVPKKSASEYYTKLYNENCNNDFTKLCYNYFHPNTIICGDITGKLTSGYYVNNDNIFDFTPIDENNKSYHFYGYSGCILIPSDYTLYGIQSFNNLMKYNKMRNTTKYEINTKITEIGTPTKTDLKLIKDLTIINREVV